MKPLSDPLFHFIDLLDHRSIPYALIGGIAVTILAAERFTHDIDLTITINEKQAAELEKYFRDDPIYKIDQINFISSKNVPDMFRIFWQETPVDLLVANTDFQKELVSRAQPYSVETRSLRVATVEDMIILKLLADRPKDREDLKALLAGFEKIDWKYVEHWAQLWKIEKRLMALRKKN